MLSLVAPITMSADQSAVWIMAAVDALHDIRASEVAEVSAQVRRTVTRPSQIVPEVSKLIAEKRQAARESQRRRSEDEHDRMLPRPLRHIAERDRSTFTEGDWEELNAYLERMGSAVRYRSDGTRVAPPLQSE
jgi:hypothetical protein